MNHQEILRTAADLAAGRIGLGVVLGVDAACVRQLAGVVRGLAAAGRAEDAQIFCDGLLALYPNDPELQLLNEFITEKPPK